MKKKLKEKDKSDKPVVLLGNTYNKNLNPWLIFAVKFFLSYCLTVGTMLCFIKFYNIPYSTKSVLQLVLLYTAAYFPLFLIIKKRILLPVLGVFAASIYLFCFDSINECILLLKDYICIQIDGRLINTIQFVPINSYAYLTRTQNFIFGINLSLLILSGVICFFMVLFSSKKFRPIPVIITWCLLYVPAFLGEKADYNHYILLLFTSFFGLVTMSGNAVHEDSSGNNSVKDSKKKRSVLKTVTDTLIKYGRNVSNGIIAVILSASILICSQYLFPNMSAIDTKGVVDALVSMGETVGEFFSDLFSGKGFTPDFNGYFSYDTFRYSNSIELNAPDPNDNRIVLKVKGSSPEGFYLSGDIGVKFENNKWISLSKYAENGKIAPDEYKISDSFDPDFMTEMFKTAVLFYDDGEAIDYNENNNKIIHYIMSRYDEEDDYYYHAFFNTFNISQELTKYNSVSIEYIMNSKTVFRPVKSTNNSYIKDKSLVTKGDRIIKIANVNDYIKSFATTVSINKDTPLFVINDIARINEEDIKTGMINSGYTYTEALQYTKDADEYTRYVYDTYLDVPENEKSNIALFLQQFSDDNPELIPIRCDYLKAYVLCEYIRDSFKYSLTADNSPQNGQTALGRFLLDTKQGHCAMYATTMTLALREMGIPARYVTGFNTGELKLMPDGTYQKQVIAKELHAWVEAYFDNIGWVTFDPTGYADNNNGQGNITETSQPETTPQTTTTTESSTTTSVNTDKSDTHITTPPDSRPGQQTTISTDRTNNSNSPDGDDNKNSINIFPILIPAIIIILIICLVAYMIAYYRKIPDTPVEKIKIQDNRKAVKELYNLILKLLKFGGISISSTELPSSFARRVDKELSFENSEPRFTQIMAIIEEAEFSQNEIADSDRKAVEEYAVRIYKLLLNNCGKIKRIYLKITLC